MQMMVTMILEIFKLHSETLFLEACLLEMVSHGFVVYIQVMSRDNAINSWWVNSMPVVQFETRVLCP